MMKRNTLVRRLLVISMVTSALVLGVILDESFHLLALGGAPAGPQTAGGREGGTTGGPLPQQVATLMDRAADQSHAMMDVAYHFSNLWFAGRSRNWPLAEFYLNEARSHLRWAVRIIPVRKDSAGNEVKLTAILESIENSFLAQLREAIMKRNAETFESAYRSMLEGCYSCHKASEKSYLRPRIPERPPAAIMNFDPAATWPN